MPLTQFFTSGSSNPFALMSSEPQFLEIKDEIDFFIRFVVKKLEAEQRNRLKTEEQSAQVIEQLGKTLTRLEMKRKELGYGSTSKMSSASSKVL